MTTEDLPGGSGPGTAHPAGVVPSPPPVREDELALLREPEFPVALRGYDREAVDAYVALVNRVIADLEAGRSPQSAIKHALDQVSEETKGILERAHETADGITSRSQAQAADRIARAEEEAREIVRGAQTKVRVLDNDADEIWRERKRLIDDVQRVSDELSELADSASRRFAEEPTEDQPVLQIAEAAEAPARDEDDEEDPDAEDTQQLPPPPPPSGA